MKREDDVTKRIFDEVERRGWSDVEFAGHLRIPDRQNIRNWRTRGFPRAKYELVAQVFGWSIEALYGREPQSEPAGIAEEPGRYETLVGPDLKLFMAEFKKLSRPLQMQVSTLVHMMVGEMRRDERAKKKPQRRPGKPGDRPNA